MPTNDLLNQQINYLDANNTTNNLNSMNYSLFLDQIARLEAENQRLRHTLQVTQAPHEIVDFRDLLGKPSGRYVCRFRPSMGQPQECSLYFDTSIQDQVWLAASYKKNRRLYTATTSFLWSASSLRSLTISSFAVSDCMDKVRSPKTYLLLCPDLSHSGETVSHLLYDYKVDKYKILANLLNGLAPSGAPFTSNWERTKKLMRTFFESLGEWRHYENNSVYVEDNSAYVEEERAYVEGCSTCRGDEASCESNVGAFWIRVV
eukprot:TRINITY_DN10717_c0_g1_i1.p1 TRINITY_DN10717_c0_g1~~TRINITY_DN10717_c0_g1_i1.p1  ORF type:complete len:291 (+),score=32.36 TRINITY_DN10717_c0_g1_i1:92-874(+)